MVERAMTGNYPDASVSTIMHASGRRYISDPRELALHLPIDPNGLARVVERYPMRISRYFMNLIESPGDPIWLQSVPDPLETGNDAGFEDPLAEESLSPVPNLVHRYPDRVLWLVSHECAMLCRFCTRKRRWKNPVPMTREMLEEGLAYIRRNTRIRDVLLSGGDPLLLPISRLESILAALRSIPHVEIIRIGTRIPCTLPEKISTGLARMLSRFHPVFMNIHFNHPSELTPQSRAACRILADAGIPLGSQTVLLKGVNDDATVLGDLFRGLLASRVRPYYLLQMDLTQGTSHFRTPVSKGLQIIRALRSHISGLALPHFVVDLPGGNGKVPLVPNHIEEITDKRIIFRNFRGEQCEYPLLEGEDEALRAWVGTGCRQLQRKVTCKKDF